MRTAAVCPTCATYTNALCVIYDGPLLTTLDIHPQDDLELILAKIESFALTGVPGSSIITQDEGIVVDYNAGVLNFVGNITAVDAGSNITTVTVPAEVNDLSAAVTWVDVPDANITLSSVKQHESFLVITESQISDLNPVTSWINLTDTDPVDFTGSAGFLVRVNSTPDGLEFVDGNTLFSDEIVETTLLTPVENSYPSTVELFADQVNQTSSFFQYIIDTDTYYEYLGTTVGDITDYRELTSTETTLLKGKQTKPVHKIYANAAALYAEQKKQIKSFLYRTSDNDFHFEYLGTTNGNATDYKQIGIVPTGLEAINEGNGIGYRVIGRDATEYGNIGLDAIDFGLSDNSYASTGATGDTSFIVGNNNTASGYGATVFGYQNLASGVNATAIGAVNIVGAASAGHNTAFGQYNEIYSDFTTAFGYFNTFTATSDYSFAAGTRNVIDGGANTVFGGYNTSKSHTNSIMAGKSNITRFTGGIGGAGSSTFGIALDSQDGAGGMVIGTANIPIINSTAGTAATDSLLTIGNGTFTTPNNANWVPITPSDAFKVFRGGEIIAPSLTTVLIDAEATGKVLITKEWIGAQNYGTTSITDNQVAVGNGTGIEGDTGLTYDAATKQMYLGVDNTSYGAFGVYGSNSTQGGLFVSFNGSTVNTNDVGYRFGANNGSFRIEGISTGTFLDYKSSTAQLSFPMYGTGTKTGTATYSLAVDASGNIIEEALGDVTPNLQAVTDEGNTTTLNIAAASFNDLNLFSQTGVDIDNIGIGIDAILNNTGGKVVGIGEGALRYNTEANSTAIGNSSSVRNQGINNTSIGYQSNSIFKDDVANLKNVADATTDIDTGLNRITIASHGFGISGTYVNLKYTTTGTPIGGFIQNDIYQFQIIDTNTIEYQGSISSIGTDVHTFTPQFAYSNVTVLGANSEPTKSDQVTLGDSNVTEVTTAGLYESTLEEVITNKAKHRLILGVDGVPIIRYQTDRWNTSVWASSDGIGIGENALESNTAYNCVAIGDTALRNNTGIRSVGVGKGSLYNNLGSSSNGFGYNTLYNNSGAGCNGVGSQALDQNTGNYCNGVGNNALSDNTGFDSNGFGLAALGINTGNYCNGVGNNALYYNSGASCNGFGYYALHSNIGSFTIGIGDNSSTFNTGSNAIGVGQQSASKNTGEDLVSIGRSSSEFNVGDSNTVVGYNSNYTFKEDTANNVTFDNTDISVVSDRITVTAHGLGTNGTWINLKYTQGTSSITGLSDATIYQVYIVDANTLSFRELITGTTYHGVDITDAGTGTGHTLTPQFVYDNVTVLGANTEPTKSNQVTLGDSAVTEVKTAGTYVSGGYTVATLPTGVIGARAYVTDSTVVAAGNFGATVAGTGSNVVPVFYDGTNWIIA
jgi:hypothetical protein